jgi:hypothetical protein
LEQLESQLGSPLPAATQWEIVEEAAQVIKPARDELIQQAAPGTVVHNDDTGMRVLMLKRDPSDERTGASTSGIVTVGEDRKIALYFTGSRHAGENLREVLRNAELPSPIQMCDALSRNVPKLPAGVEVLLDNCLAHRTASGWADPYPLDSMPARSANYIAPAFALPCAVSWTGEPKHEQHPHRVPQNLDRPMRGNRGYPREVRHG